MKEIQLKKIIKVCPDCGFEIISFVSDDEPIVMSDDINGVFVLCPKCRDVNNPMICFCADEKLLRKATINEIIEHFKNDKDNIKQ